MYTVLSKVYLEVAERLSALIGTSQYYSGAFEIDFEDVSCRMVLSAVIYRHNETLPEGQVVDLSRCNRRCGSMATLIIVR